MKLSTLDYWADHDQHVTRKLELSAALPAPLSVLADYRDGATLRSHYAIGIRLEGTQLSAGEITLTGSRWRYETVDGALYDATDIPGLVRRIMPAQPGRDRFRRHEPMARQDAGSLLEDPR